MNHKRKCPRKSTSKKKAVGFKRRRVSLDSDSSQEEHVKVKDHNLGLIPNKKIISLQDLEEDDAHYIAKIMVVAQNLAVKHGITDSGYRLITNCGKDGGQEVPYLHFHLVGGVKLGKMISLPKESKKLFKKKITKTMV